jgi:hypothetical protein
MSIASAALAVSLAFHPYSAPTGAFRVAEPEAQPGWDEIEAESKAEETPPAEVEPPATPEPAVAPPPAAVPAAMPPPTKPEHDKGTGLIIAASVTGALAWGAAFARMAFVKQCQERLESAETIETGAGAAVTCFFRAGVANVVVGMFQVPLNWATWGLAGAAGGVRGGYDGIEDAWARKNPRATGAFIGAGAAVLGLGIAGRITAAALTSVPYKKLADADVDGFSRGLRVRYFGVQLSSAAIAAGAGLLAYGVAYKKNHRGENNRLQQVRLAPAYSVDPAGGGTFTGVSLSGRF